MKVLTKTQIYADNTGPKIRCSTLDALTVTPCPTAFVFDQTLDHDALFDSLKIAIGAYPMFGGAFKVEKGQLYLNCNEQGVQFEVIQREETLEEALCSLLGKTHNRLVSAQRKLVPSIRFGLERRGSLTKIRVSQFRNGGTIIGVCWHHSIADWVSFLHFFKTWSDVMSGRPLAAPTIDLDRHRFIDERVDDKHSSPGFRKMHLLEAAWFGLSLVFSKPRQRTLMFWFSDKEIRAMRDDLQQRSSEKLSVNDAFVAHFVNLLNEVDPRDAPRNVTIAIDWRRRADISDSVMGNFVGFVNLPYEHEVAPEQFAMRLRRKITDWQPRYASVTQFIESQGGCSNYYRILPIDVDILHGIALSNLNRSGALDIKFGSVGPVFFIPFLVTSFPWYGLVVDGFANQGTQLVFTLPGTVADRLCKPDMLDKLHRYRSSAPDKAFSNRFPWLL